MTPLCGCCWDPRSRNRWVNPLNAKLNPICHLLVLLGAHPILHVSRINVKEGPKRGIFGSFFQKLYDRAKACICTNGAYFE
jgi:hypothetical protein